jgi:hypothetical protein
MTFFQPVPLVGSCGQKPFSRKPGGARPVDGRKARNARSIPAFWFASRLFSCKGDIHAKSESC